ncbi:hypothetical protein S245_021559, partial [Arachis hypogaea]
DLGSAAVNTWSLPPFLCQYFCPLQPLHQRFLRLLVTVCRLRPIALLARRHHLAQRREERH